MSKNKRNPLKERRFENIGMRIKVEVIDERDNIVWRSVKPQKKAKSLLEELFNLKL